MYDIFYASKNKIDAESWLKIKNTYPTAQKVENVKSFNDLNSRAFTKMFWVIWDDLELTDNLNLVDYRATEWDNMYVHVFKNKDFFDGVCLFPKNKKISQREFDHRFFVDKKEIDIVASTPKLFQKFNIKTYNEYVDAATNTTSTMFWAIWDNINVDYDFNYQVPFYNQRITHIFKNGNYYDGICLFPKNKLISQREFNNRFFVEKKEIDIVASTPVVQIYDIMFISYSEPTADETYNSLVKKFPRAKRVHGIKGIHQAHIAAANLADTELFYVVDGDAVIADTFNFDYIVPQYEKGHVHVWRSVNPVNGLKYGYGGVKLLPREKTINMDLSKPDMTTSISSNFKSLKEISNITAFNTDPFNTWKSAFRECCKLSSKVIDRQNETETNARLEVWCTSGKDKPYGNFAIDGAVAGTEYGNTNRDNLEALKKINDFDWLKEQYEQRAKNICS
jgi:hypothetical protein